MVKKINLVILLLVGQLFGLAIGAERRRVSPESVGSSRSSLALSSLSSGGSPICGAGIELTVVDGDVDRLAVPLLTRVASGGPAARVAQRSVGLQVGEVPVSRPGLIARCGRSFDRCMSNPRSDQILIPAAALGLGFLGGILTMCYGFPC